MADRVHSIIVDDEPDRGIITKYLGECGFSVVGAASEGPLHIRAEQALRRDLPIPRSISWGQIRQVFDSMPIRIALLDLNHRHCYVNTEWSRFFGIPADAALGRTIAEVLGEETFASVRAQDERALAGEVAEWGGWVEDQFGRRYVRRTCAPLRGMAGPIDGYFVFSSDLTELRRTEQNLVEQSAARSASEALNAAIVAAAADCIITLDETGRVVEFNPAAERTFGRPRANVLGQPVDTLLVLPHERQGYAESFTRFVASGARDGQRYELEARRADGSSFPAEVSVAEVPLPEGRLFIVYLRDLTPERKAESEIERQREALQTSERMAAFGSLLAGVAHELNNPLSIVIGNALLLAEETEGSGLAERAQRVQMAAERCGRIVRTFLAMARHRQAEKRPATVQALLDAAVGLLAYQMRTSGVILEQNIAPGLPALLCDSDQMVQVLANLLTNARQALEERPQPRRVRLTTQANSGWLQIEVADNGPGIAEAIRSRVFDPFFTTKPAGAGTGVGLAVSRGIVEAHGGSLSLASPNGEGACFVIRLPLIGDGATAAEADVAPKTQHMPIQAAPTVLVVDDEPDIGQMLAEMLRSLGYRSDVKASGEAAQAALRERDYDAVLCDLRLPGLDGPTFYDWMAGYRPNLCARTAFITADTLSPSSHRFLTRAKRPVLEKPFLPADLRQLLSQLLPDAQVLS
jgi:two-component system NtrC family sensor kinase